MQVTIRKEGYGSMLSVGNADVCIHYFTESGTWIGKIWSNVAMKYGALDSNDCRDVLERIIGPMFARSREHPHG